MPLCSWTKSQGGSPKLEGHSIPAALHFNFDLQEGTHVSRSQPAALAWEPHPSRVRQPGPVAKKHQTSSRTGAARRATPHSRKHQGGTNGLTVGCHPHGGHLNAHHDQFGKVLILLGPLG